MVRILGKQALLMALVFIPVQVAQTPAPTIPEPSPYSRVAATGFAMQNGWPFPKANLVGAIDPFFGFVDGHPVRQSTIDQAKEAPAV